jgi:hypothetical protein
VVAVPAGGTVSLLARTAVDPVAVDVTDHVRYAVTGEDTAAPLVRSVTPHINEGTIITD